MLEQGPNSTLAVKRALQNAWLEREIRPSEDRYRRELTVFNSIAAMASQALDLDEMLEGALDEVLSAMGEEAGAIYLLDEERGELVLTIQRGMPQENLHPASRVKIGEGMVGRLITSEEAMMTGRFSDYIHIYPQLAAACGETPVSFISTTLRVKGRALGVMSIVSRQQREFSPQDKEFFTAIGRQIGVAVENAQLFAETQRRVQELASLNEVGRTMTSHLDLEQILTIITQEAKDLVGAEAGYILLLDEESGELVFETSVGSLSQVLKGQRPPPGCGIAGWVAHEDQPLLVPDARQDPRFYAAIDELTGLTTRSLLCVPLKVKDEMIGVVEVMNKSEGGFSEDDLKLLDSMAISAAIAIENARLYQCERAKRRTADALQESARILNSALALDKVLSLILEQLARVIGYDSASIMLVSANALAVVAARGFPEPERAMEVTFNIAEDPKFQQMQWDKKPLVIHDTRQDERWLPWSGTEHIRSWVGAPLVIKDKVIGTINVDKAQPGYYSEAEAQVVFAFAHQAATAIENARLYENLHQQMRELKKTQAQLVQSAKLAAIGELAAGVAHEINNPLTTIMGYTQLLLRGIDETDPRRQDLEVITREAARTRAILKHLLDFARRTEPKLEKGDINDVVRATLSLVYHQAKKARVKINEIYCSSLPLILMDANQMKQVFLNIINNAIQAMPQGGELTISTEEVWADTESGQTERFVAVRLADSGVGIPPENLHRIFDPFFTTKPRGEGTGLGLSISYGIVERHGGRIEVKSEVGQGSMFSVLLPRENNSYDL